MPGEIGVWHPDVSYPAKGWRPIQARSGLATCLLFKVAYKWFAVRLEQQPESQGCDTLTNKKLSWAKVFYLMWFCFSENEVVYYHFLDSLHTSIGLYFVWTKHIIATNGCFFRSKYLCGARDFTRINKALSPVDNRIPSWFLLL